MNDLVGNEPKANKQLLENRDSRFPKNFTTLRNRWSRVVKPLGIDVNTWCFDKIDITFAQDPDFWNEQFNFLVHYLEVEILKWLEIMNIIDTGNECSDCLKW